MSKPVQEKGETRVPREPEGIEGGGWATDASARRPKERQLNRAGRESAEVFYQELPPGMNTYDQNVPPRARPRQARGGLGAGTQATVDVTQQSLREGFSRKAMSATDDHMPGENEPFYKTVEVDGVEGFVERGNTLDRM